ncbi:hypothetical protein Tco_0359660 [Tanacetum coccineum]
MDWLSKRKIVIICHEKVVRIPLEGDEILQVHKERTLGAAKALMNAKIDELKLSDISVVRDFFDVFPGDLSMTTGATSLVPYRLGSWSDAGREVSISSSTLRNAKISKEEHEVHLKLVLESLRKEKLYAKFSKLGDALSRKERVKSRRVRGMILASQSEAFKQENEWNSGDDQLRLRWMIYLVVLAEATESVRDAIGFEYCLASSSGWTKSPVLWAEIGEGSLIGPKLVQEMTDKVVVIKEKLKAARDRQKTYADKRRKLLEFEVGDRVLLRVSPWKGVVRFRKKGKLALRYVGTIEILERIGLVAYRLRLPEELNSVHDIFHVSNLKKCLADANLHVPLDEIKVDNTLRFVEEPIEIMDQEIKKLKCSRIPLVKVR